VSMEPSPLVSSRFIGHWWEDFFALCALCVSRRRQIIVCIFMKIGVFWDDGMVVLSRGRDFIRPGLVHGGS
jgi:hypothetical protein